MLMLLLSKFGIGAIAQIGNLIEKAIEVKANAQTEQERIAAQENIARLQAQQAVLIAEQANPVTRWIRPGFAIPFMLFNAKVLIWDKMLHLGTTDPMSAEMFQLEMMVFSAYFVGRALEKAVTTWKK